MGAPCLLQPCRLAACILPFPRPRVRGHMSILSSVKTGEGFPGEPSTSSRQVASLSSFLDYLPACGVSQGIHGLFEVAIEGDAVPAPLVHIRKSFSRSPTAQRIASSGRRGRPGHWRLPAHGGTGLPCVPGRIRGWWSCSPSAAASGSRLPWRSSEWVRISNGFVLPPGRKPCYAPRSAHR